MKKVVFLLALTVGSLILNACKEPLSSEETVQPSEENSAIPLEQLALAETEALAVSPSNSYLYVTAPSGLSLREYNNLQSEKIAKMPYGTKVRVIRQEGKNTMNVAGIPGAMDEIEFNHKKGYAFNGYLSQYFPPELDITVQGYAAELIAQFPEVTYIEVPSESKSAPITSQTLILPHAQWHEAFIIAQRLFDFPKEFDVPSSKGKDFEVIEDSQPKRAIWTSQLKISRKDNVFQKIEYIYSSKNFKSTISIYKEGDGMVLTKKEAIE